MEIDVVTEANDRFYRALEAADPAKMADVWLHADWVKCVHPGWDLIIGWEKIYESWKQIFSNQSGMRVSTTEVEIKLEANFALVSCYENLAIFLDNSSAPVSARATATNLFQRIEGRWLMIHHHASQTPNAPLVTESDLIQ